MQVPIRQLTTAEISKIVKEQFEVFASYNDRLANGRRKLKYVISWKTKQIDKKLQTLRVMFLHSNVESVDYIDNDFIRICKKD